MLVQCNPFRFCLHPVATCQHALSSLSKAAWRAKDAVKKCYVDNLPFLTYVAKPMQKSGRYGLIEGALVGAVLGGAVGYSSSMTAVSAGRVACGIFRLATFICMGAAILGTLVGAGAAIVTFFNALRISPIIKQAHSLSPALGEEAMATQQLLSHKIPEASADEQKRIWTMIEWLLHPDFLPKQKYQRFLFVYLCRNEEQFLEAAANFFPKKAPKSINEAVLRGHIASQIIYEQTPKEWHRLYHWVQARINAFDALDPLQKFWLVQVAISYVHHEPALADPESRLERIYTKCNRLHSQRFPLRQASIERAFCRTDPDFPKIYRAERLQNIIPQELQALIDTIEEEYNWDVD